MTKYLNVQEERAGTRRFYLGGIVAVLVIIGAAIVWPFLSPKPQNTPNAPRTDQASGASTIAKRTAPPPSATPHATTPETVGRNERIEGSAQQSPALSDDQRKAVSDYATQHAQQKMDRPDFTIAVGAAVPQKVALNDIPTSLTDTLSAYNGDQYFLVANQFVVVERATRRIVAIIPVAA